MSEVMCALLPITYSGSSRHKWRDVNHLAPFTIQRSITLFSRHHFPFHARGRYCVWLIRQTLAIQLSPVRSDSSCSDRSLAIVL